MYQPLNYESINTYNGTRTPTGTVQYDQTTAYFWRCLYHRLLSNIRFNLPSWWNPNYFKNVLYGVGFIGVVKTSEYGVIPQICSVSGYGLYLEPNRVLVAQPLVKFEGKRGVDCEIIRIAPDWCGVLDIVDHYAFLMAQCYTSVNVALINSRAGIIGYAKNKQASETLKYIAEQISSGEAVVVADKEVKPDGLNGEDPIFTHAFDPANNYISDKLLTDLTTILNQFDREIGIPIIDDKKERRIETEVNTMISDSGCRMRTWEECLHDSIAATEKVFPELTGLITFKTSLEQIQEGGNENESDAAFDYDRSL